MTTYLDSVLSLQLCDGALLSRRRGGERKRKREEKEEKEVYAYEPKRTTVPETLAYCVDPALVCAV